MYSRLYNLYNILKVNNNDNNIINNNNNNNRNNNDNLPENQFEQMISYRGELKNEQEHYKKSRMVQTVSQLLYCKKMVHNPLSTTTTTTIEGSE